MNYKFTPLGGKVSSSNDLGFTYGEMEINFDGEQNEQFNYMRVWKNDGKNWIILAEVANKIEK
jgi:hypothetical protein